MVSLRTKLEVLTVVGLLTVGALYWGTHRPGKVVSVTNPTPTTQVVTVDGPVTTKVITQTVTDPTAAKEVESLLAENKALRTQVETLTSTAGTLQEKGGNTDGGTITPVTPPGSGLASPSQFNFKDFELNATYRSDGSKFDYALKQSLIVTTSTGKRSDGSRLSLVELSQQTPSGPLKIPIQTVEIQLPENPTRWFTSPRIQGGLGFGSSGKVGLVGLQWLRFGSTPAAEDTRFSLLTPAVGSNGLTLLPVSVNLGRIKHNPLTNLWVSPTVDTNRGVGIALTATF